MINGDPHEFLESIYSGQDTVYLFRGIKYWYQGYYDPETQMHHMEIWQEDPPEPGYIWTYESKKFEDCMAAFLKAPVFGGKTYWEAEEEIEWTD